MRKYISIPLILFIIFSGCKKKSELEKLLPEKLGNLELEQTTDSKENLFSRIVTQTKNPIASLIAEYQNENSSATLYLSSYSDTLSAIATFHLIMKALRADTVNYKHVIPRFDGNLFFLMALNENKLNYFFTKAKYLYWLSCERSSGENLIRDLITFSR